MPLRAFLAIGCLVVLVGLFIAQRQLDAPHNVLVRADAGKGVYWCQPSLEDGGGTTGGPRSADASRGTVMTLEMARSSGLQMAQICVDSDCFVEKCSVMGYFLDVTVRGLHRYQRWTEGPWGDDQEVDAYYWVYRLH